MSVGHICEPHRNDQTNRNSIWVGDCGGPKEPCLRCSPYLPKGSSNWGLSGPLKSIVSHGCGAHSKKSMMASAQLLQSSALHPTDWCHINFSREKSATPCNAAFLQNSLTACCQIDMGFCHHINVAALRFRTVELIRLVVFGLG